MQITEFDDGKVVKKLFSTKNTKDFRKEMAKRAYKAFGKPNVASVKFTKCKPGDRIIWKGVSYVFHTSGMWRNQSSGELVNDPATDPYHKKETI